MKTITLKYAGEISQPEYVPPGSRITSSGGGVIEWTPGNLIEAAQNPTWRPWARGAMPGYMDTLRGVTVRATAAGAMKINIEESRNDPFIPDAYFDVDIAYWNIGGTEMAGPGGEDAMPVQPVLHSQPGLDKVNFGDAQPYTTLSTQNTCTAVLNPTGWHDGTGCLELTGNPGSEGFTECRIYFDAGKQFRLESGDGFAVELEIPDLSDITTNSSFSVELGVGATSTATPANRTEYRLLVQQNAQPIRQKGRRYLRFRWDLGSTEATAGPYPGYAPVVTGNGITQYGVCNWLRFTWGNMTGKTFKIKRIVSGGRAQPCIVLMTDSVQGAHIEHAGPSLVSRGIAPSMVLADTVEQFPGLRRIHEAWYTRGRGDIIPNDVIDRNLVVAGVPEQEIYDMLVECDRRLLKYGWTRARKIYSYNNNAYNNACISALQRAGYRAARAGSVDGRYVFTEGGVGDPYRIPAVGIDGKNAADIITIIDRTIQYGATLWMYYHQPYSKAKIVADGQTAVSAGQTPQQYATVNPSYCAANGINSGTIWTEEFDAAMEYLAQKVSEQKIITMTPSQWCNAVGL